jgi:molybdopterin/thiamine biosynthesis adenylyltransferase
MSGVSGNGRGGYGVVVVGAGGNIGSQVVPLIARWKSVRTLTLIDRDVYEARNLAGQNITPADVGRSKARCQARCVRRIRSDIGVRLHHSDVERLPLGRLRGDVILACLDSRRSRQHVNEAARRLGIPWIDSGVEAQGMLARVTVYGAGDEHACLECGWDQRDYEVVEASYACQGERHGRSPATNAPASLGALAAALQVVECQKLLSEAPIPFGADREVMLDVLHHRHYVARLRRNRHCRLADHSCWPIERLPSGTRHAPLADIVERVVGVDARRVGATLACFGQHFVRSLLCPGCGRQQQTLVASRAVAGGRSRCRYCQTPLVAGTLDVTERLAVHELEPRFWRSTLARLGLCCGDVLTLSVGRSRLHLEIGDDAR